MPGRVSSVILELIYLYFTGHICVCVFVPYLQSLLCERFRRWTDSLKIHEGGKGKGKRDGRGGERRGEQENKTQHKEFMNKTMYVL